MQTTATLTLWAIQLRQFSSQLHQFSSQLQARRVFSLRRERSSGTLRCVRT